MNNRRKHLRIKVEAHCILKGLDGSSFPAVLDDISLSGASVQAETGGHFRVGDVCDLMLSDESAEYPIKHTGEIVRISPESIGVSFIIQ